MGPRCRAIEMRRVEIPRGCIRVVALWLWASRTLIARIYIPRGRSGEAGETGTPNFLVKKEASFLPGKQYSHPRKPHFY